MSGHSKWSQIKHKKGAADQKKGQLFSKLSKMISVAAKDSPDPTMNPQLQALIERARSFNMPKDNIERAIKRGQDTSIAELITVIYQALAAGSTALIIIAVTDNSNRTLGEIKTVLNKHNAKLAVEGSLNWLFERKAIIAATGRSLSDLEQLALIEFGADDILIEPEGLTVLATPDKLQPLVNELKHSGWQIASADIEYVARNNIRLNPIDTSIVTDLLNALDDLDDVEAVYTNTDLNK